MKSYTTSRNLIAGFCNVDTSDTTKMAVLDQYFNDSIRTIATMRGGKWAWLFATVTIPTVANGQTYQIPNKIRKITDLYVLVATQPYLPSPIFDSNIWNRVLASRLGASDIPLYYFPVNKTVLIAPSSSTTAGTIYIRGRINLRDLSIADYTTGSIVSVANNGTAVVGSTTSWTASMAGRYIKITDSNTDNKGDGNWYEIASVESATALTLVKPYEGTTISAGAAAYTIGQMSPIPESFDMAPIYRSSALFWANSDPKKSKQYWQLYDGGKEAGYLSETAPIGGLMAQMIEECGESVEGAYISPNPINQIDPNQPPRYPISGF